MEWQKIESAPKDGTEILCYREGSGVFIARYTSLADFLSNGEQGAYSEESLFSCDWFCADFAQGSRLDADLMPTHWVHLPPPPNEE